MFFSLLLIQLSLSAVITYGVIKLFDKPIAAILHRIIQDEISVEWCRYIKFAALVVGISGGTRIYQLERYISSPNKDIEVLVLNSERWILEIYRTIIDTLQSIVWMYLVVFIFALIAYAVVKGFELRRGS